MEFKKSLPGLYGTQARFLDACKKGKVIKVLKLLRKKINVYDGLRHALAHLQPSVMEAILRDVLVKN